METGVALPIQPNDGVHLMFHFLFHLILHYSCGIWSLGFPGSKLRVQGSGVAIRGACFGLRVCSPGFRVGVGPPFLEV